MSICNLKGSFYLFEVIYKFLKNEIVKNDTVI